MQMYLTLLNHSLKMVKMVNVSYASFTLIGRDWATELNWTEP